MSGPDPTEFWPTTRSQERSKKNYERLASRLPERLLPALRIDGFRLAGDNAGSASCVSLFLPPSLGSSVAPSSATIAAPRAGIRHCNSPVSPAANENAARIPSAESSSSAGVGLAVGRVPDLPWSVDSSSGPTGVWLPVAHALEGTSLLSGAQQVPVQHRLKSLSQSKEPRWLRFCVFFSRPASAVGRPSTNR
jgi:hypothetical protein